MLKIGGAVGMWVVACAAMFVAPVCAQERNHDDIQAHVLIGELMGRYAVVHDFGTPEEYADLFTNDAELSVGDGTVLAKGREALIAMATRDHERFDAVQDPDGKTSSIMRHLINNMQITLTGPKTATGTCYVTTIVRKGDVGPAILSVGRYVDSFAMQGGKWRIAKRSIILEFGNDDLAREMGFQN